MTEWPANIAVHPAAELFPLMTEPDLAALAEDIALNGLRMPVVLDTDGRILDGRNRFLACQQQGVSVGYVEETGEPWQYVISTNLHRRHLTDGQRAMIAAKIADRHQGRPPKNRPADDVSPTREQVADMLHVSRSQISRARQVHQDGIDELKTLVENGAVPVATAARVATILPKAEQRLFAAKVRGGANPRHVAPPEKEPEANMIPPTSLVNKPITGTARMRKRVQVLDIDTIARVTATWDGYALGLSDITGIDPDATEDQCDQWERSITKTIRALSRFRRLVKGHHA